MRAHCWRRGGDSSLVSHQTAEWMEYIMRVMRVAAGVIALTLLGANALASPETMRFAITRNGEQIGTHEIAINRNGAETSVNVVTDLAVKVLFVTAYHLQWVESERWVNGRLVALNSQSDNNGERHSVSLAAKGSGLEMKVDGTSALIDANIVPGSFWSPELLRRPMMLDTKDGQLMPVTVQDGGEEDLTINDQVVRAHHYTIKSRYSQDLWYDAQARLVQAKLIASDGSIIMYRPL
jgi:hypothetical protein